MPAMTHELEPADLDLPGALGAPDTEHDETALQPLGVADGVEAVPGGTDLVPVTAEDRTFGELPADVEPTTVETRPVRTAHDDADLLDETADAADDEDDTAGVAAVETARAAVNAALDEQPAAVGDGSGDNIGGPDNPTGGGGSGGGEGEDHDPAEEEPEDRGEGDAELEALRELDRQVTAIQQRERAVEICAGGGFSDFVDLSDVPDSATNVEAPTKLLGFGEDSKITWSNVNPDRPDDKPSHSQRMQLTDREVALVDAVVTQPDGISEDDLAFLDRVRAEVNSGYGAEVTKQNMPVRAAMGNLMPKTDGTIIRTEDGGFMLAPGVKVIDNRQRGNDGPVDEEVVAEMREAIREIVPGYREALAEVRAK